jgi:4-amino-4-deoxychorismate lyase
VESALREGSGEPGLRLIETMFWDAVDIRRWDLHMARMARGADLLGWPWDAKAALATVEACELVEQARVRLTMDADGRFEATLSPLPPPAAEWRLVMAGERLSSHDPWLRIKTTRRAAYDRARAALPVGIDEAIFLNERGEVCDGTITTVFFDRGQGMRTPPLSSGLLPGVLRAEIGCPEEVLMADDLPKVRLWVGNALRGLISARL